MHTLPATLPAATRPSLVEPCLSSRSYCPYGVPSRRDELSIGFAGQFLDVLSGTHPLGNGHRGYSPTLRRFLSADAASPFAKGGINAYAYCAGDPVNRTDPSGRDWLSRLISGVSIVSSSVTGIGAIARTARDGVNRLQAQRQGTPHVETGYSTRLGNVSFFYTSVMGVIGTVFNGVEQGWIGNVLTTHGRRLGIGNAIGNISGGLLSNAEAMQTVWRGVGAPGVSAGRVAWETVYEVTGARLLTEGASYVWQGVRALGDRVAQSWQAATGAWRTWQNPMKRPSASPGPGIPMRDIRT